jgi:phosphoribosylformimino-5-aminoimidazole carboxamide ribotide isomerase
VVLGTAAVESPDLVEELLDDAGGAVAVGLDARGRDVAVRGWEESSGVDLLDAVRRFSTMGVDALVVTEIGRDGTLDGPDVVGLAAVVGEAGVPVVASGGVGSLDHLRALRELPVDGVIVGRALYAGAFTVPDAVEVLA